MLNVLSGSFKSTSHLLILVFVSKTGLTFSTQAAHLILLLKFKVLIIFNFCYLLIYFFIFNLKLFKTTLTELNAMAAPANIGFNKYPVKGYKIPAAIGIPMTLYINAQNKFSFKVCIVC